MSDIEDRIRGWLNKTQMSNYWIGDLCQKQNRVFDGFIFRDWQRCVRLAVDDRGLDQRPNESSYIYGIEEVWVIVPEKSKSWKTELNRINKISNASRAVAYNWFTTLPQILQIYRRYGGYFVEGPWWEVLSGSFQKKLQIALDKNIQDQIDEKQSIASKQHLELNKKRKQFSQSKDK